ncbi:MAG: spore coat associated protein CotJA [Clostridia bacterium]|nr:spore coat associated protein CotJA [Clostridia bacterium]
MSELKFKGFITPERPEKPMKFSDTKLKDLPIAMAYVPMQKWTEVYTEEDALCRGTLFPELDKPFYGKFTGAKR